VSLVLESPAVAVPRRDPYQSFRSALPPARVRELSRLRPWRAVVDVAWSWAAIVAAWLAADRLETPWAYALAALVVGNRYYALYIIGHDGLHRRLFDSFRANDRFCDLFVLGPIGAVTRINNKNHLLHHQHLANPQDPDRHKHGCFNKATSFELAGYLSAVTSVARSVANVFAPGERAPVPDDEPARSGAPRHTVADLAILLLWQAALCAGLWALFGWWGYFAMWWLPVFLFTFSTDNFRAFVEHSHPESDARADEHRLITHLPNRLERALFAPMNMNFHAAHHLWPSIPYYNLPAADRELRRATAGDTAITWRRSYLGYLWRYWRKLPLEECRVADARG
jgi:fatty acid desaturase